MSTTLTGWMADHRGLWHRDGGRAGVNCNHVAFCGITGDLLQTQQVQSMAKWCHHGRVSTLDHAIFVAYVSYRIARRLGLDNTAVARGGLLHDLYLYHKRDRSAHPGLQCFDHPKVAARNAARITTLTPMEENIILSHMWPVGGALPRSAEAWLVDGVDTLCALLEQVRLYHPGRLSQAIQGAAQTLD